MKIQLRFFASVREALGVSQESLDIPDSVNTVGAVRVLLRERGGVWAEALGENRSLRMAYDQQMTDADTQVKDGGEVAFFPPVTGG
ncbi:molybdopterin converting factor subunit 1 [Oxalicibacterium faecigallinarum]|uniref:Molybdopterin synthase sulfur carrier subunit n=1 Tax=Oxalicibacterium faecigallinarum TaxID=573741 RepID=A0A8J3AW37_9BURK|nr:molybdopterin converting factor subunit 1 [Oxalicibacterium faecigallinarum]GGI17666.1 molybdopterin synthase sulfur carrier subunit [Oxalicibacterium faecigallinarum]